MSLSTVVGDLSGAGSQVDIYLIIVCMRLCVCIPQAEVESTAAGLVNEGDLEAARAMLTKHSNESALAAVSSYHSLFETLVAKYHDGYQMQVRQMRRGRRGAMSPAKLMYQVCRLTVQFFSLQGLLIYQVHGIRYRLLVR